MPKFGDPPLPKASADTGFETSDPVPYMLPMGLLGEGDADGGKLSFLVMDGDGAIREESHEYTSHLKSQARLSTSAAPFVPARALGMPCARNPKWFDLWQAVDDAGGGKVDGMATDTTQAEEEEEASKSNSERTSSGDSPDLKTEAGKTEAHIRGECKPCAYFWAKTDSCRRGEECTFCHLCDPGELTRRKRASKQMRRRAAANGASNGAVWSAQGCVQDDWWCYRSPYTNPWLEQEPPAMMLSST